MRTLTREALNVITPSVALGLLQQGNNRFIDNLKVNRNLLQQAKETSDGQYPFAVILSCIDSRTPPELIFDQGLGDIFTARIAGNIINEDILGSLEYACKAGVKMIVILGHTQCGAIKGACDHVEMGNLTNLLEKIQPAIAAEKTIIENRNSHNFEFVDKVSAINVKNTVHEVITRSPVLRQMIANGLCGIIGATHDLETGKVHFYKETMLHFFKPNNKPPDITANEHEYQAKL